MKISKKFEKFKNFTEQSRKTLHQKQRLSIPSLYPILFSAETFYRFRDNRRS